VTEQNKNNEFIILPDYMEGSDDHIKHVWKRWYLLGKKIDNHPDRFVDIMNPKTGALKTIDCKTSVGLAVKHARSFGASEVDIEDLRQKAVNLQKIKLEKAALNREWSKAVFGRKKGDRTVLDLRFNEIIDLYSKFYSTEEITRYITDKWGLAVKFETVRKFFLDNKEKIEKKRAEYILSGKEIRLATDVGRLELLSKMAWELECKFDKTKSLEVAKEIRGIVEQIRKEVKGDELKLTIDGKIDINATIQANLTLQEALKLMPINSLVIGLTAAKQGINPAHMIGSLSNSYYSKVNGFNKLGDKNEVELPGKYIKSYNWEDLKRKNEQVIEDVQPIETYENNISENDRVVAKTQKQQLLEILNTYKKQIK
jgi:hypothetical protein